MKNLLTPKQVARAIGVSESSLKRWCDRGLIPTVKTPGGHRRLPIQGVLEFLRGSHHQVVRPEILGLPPATGQGPRVLARAADEYFAGLRAADEQRCRQILLDLYLAEHRLGVICDRVVAPAFHQIGQSWQSGGLHVYQERLACEITRRALYELRSVLATPQPSAPVAMGGTPEGDFYMLPTRMAELVLIQCGWQAVSLGSSLPLETLATALSQHRPRLFWLSVSHIEDRPGFFTGFARLYRAAARAGVALVVGGRALTDEVRSEMQYSAYGDNLQHLEAFAATLATAASIPAGHERPTEP